MSVQFPFAPAALMTAPHRGTSAARCALSAAGVAISACTGSVPRLAKRSITLGSFNAVWSAATSLSVISFGRPFGAHKACHAETSNPLTAPASSVGRSGKDDTLDFVVTAKPLILPSLIWLV